MNRRHASDTLLSRFHGSTCGRRRPRQSYHRRHDETAQQFGVREDGRNIDRHRGVKYCTEVGTSALINNKRFRQLDVVTGDAYEIELNKQVVNFHSTSVSSSTSTPSSACYSSITTLSTGTSNDRCSSTAKWTQIRRTLR